MNKLTTMSERVFLKADIEIEQNKTKRRCDVYVRVSGQKTNEKIEYGQTTKWIDKMEWK